MQLSDRAVDIFREEVWHYYAQHGRSTLPWRQPEPDGKFDPYRIMVSELMLQQTQVVRVVPKFEAFLRLFPDVTALAAASLGDVLRAWQGLGYNRRAKFLWQAAQAIQSEDDKAFPSTLKALVALPGVGVNTAGAILAYAYNQPVSFIETNVRTVYIHHFFAGQAEVHDKDIALLVEQTVDHENPREWYWAIMDYGSHLKSTVGNVARASKHFTRQSKFEGSRRQIRGQVIRSLGEQSRTLQELVAAISDERLQEVLEELIGEGLVQEKHGQYSVD